MNRREFVRLLLAAAAVQTLPRSTWAQAKFSSDPFSLGVASGSPRHDGFVLWTRLANGIPLGSPVSDQPLAINWELATDEAFKKIVRRGQAPALPALAHSVHVELTGLRPDTWYWYRFSHGNAESAIGRTRTFPAPDSAIAKMRLAFGSCQRWESGYYAAWRHMLAEQPDVVLFLGDYIYEYAASVKSVRPHTLPSIKNLGDYRLRYALYKSDPDLQRMHAACPWLFVWDDHEVQNDYAGLTASDRAVDFPARRMAAYQAYYEHMPLRASTLTRGLAGIETGAELRIYDRVAFGRLGMIHLLDDRQYRDEQSCIKESRSKGNAIAINECKALLAPERTMLGLVQERWLTQGLSEQASGKGQHWNIIAQQTLFSQRDFRFGPGEVISADTWDGYPAARNRLIDTLTTQRPTNPVFVGGDIHQNWVSNVKADFQNEKSQVIASEFCGTSISSDGGSNKSIAGRLRENPHAVFAEAEHRGYSICDITPKQLIATLRVVDDAKRSDAGVSTLAAFAVESGHPEIQRL